MAQVLQKLQWAGNRCRERRQELSLLLVEPNISDPRVAPRAENAIRQVREAIGSACAALDRESVLQISVTPARTAVVLCNCERRGAVAVAQNAITKLWPVGAGSRNDTVEPPLGLSAGIATVCCVPKNFDPTTLLESAERCLSAARACGISNVKSIEV